MPMVCTASNGATPGDTVLKTAELLEAILLHLTSHDILVDARRVCKRWKQAISDSPAIQTKLWLRPQTNKLLPPAGCLRDNPKTSELHSGPALSEGSGSHYATTLDLPWYNIDRVAHNEFFPSDDPHGSLPDMRPSRGDYGALLPGLPGWHVWLLRNLKQKQDLDGVHPTWLDMYLTEPRITVVCLEVTLPILRLGKPAVVEVTVSVRELRGLTFRSIHDVLDGVSRSHLSHTPVDDPDPDTGAATGAAGVFMGR